jgi:hypothetical protein
MNPFAVLRLDPSCDDMNVVIAAYQSRLLKCKPDAKGNSFTPEFQQVQKAYEEVQNLVLQKMNAEPPRREPQRQQRQLQAQTQRRTQVQYENLAKQHTPANPFGNKSFDMATFNALFDIEKAKRVQNEPPPELQPFNPIDSSDLQCSTIVEGDGLLMLKDPNNFDSNKWGDLQTFERDVQTAFQISLNDIDPETLHSMINQRKQQLNSVISENEQKTKMSGYLHQELPRNNVPFNQSKEMLYKQQVDKLKKEEQEAREYIRQKLSSSSDLYPEYTRQRFYKGELDRFRTN